MRAFDAIGSRPWRSLLSLVVVLEGAGSVPAAAVQVESRVVAHAPAADVVLAHDRLWTAWFANDVTSLEELLLDDFVAMNAGEPGLSGRAAVLRAAAEFVTGTGRVLSISFPQRIVRVYGSTTAVYSTYIIDVEQGREVYRITGRASVTLVRTDGGWAAAAWHLEGRQ